MWSDRLITKRKKLIRFVINLLAIVSICSCVNQTESPQSDGKNTFVAPVGSPPVDSIVWSPTDNKILVTAGDAGEGRAEIYVLDVVTGDRKVLVSTDYGDFVSSTWAPDGKRVLLVARQGTIGSGDGGVWLLDMESGSLEYLLNSGDTAWSPDGKIIATFTNENMDNNSNRITLRLINVETKTQEIIYENTELKYFFGLSWSPNGQTLVFALGDEDPGNLFTVNMQTHQVTQITQNIKSTDPTWSPNGDIIAYTDWPPKGSKTTLHLISSDGNCDIQVPGLEYVWSPTWSPNGKLLGYIGPDGIYYLELEKIFGRDVYENLCLENTK